jgi:hypothetical protein
VTRAAALAIVVVLALLSAPAAARAPSQFPCRWSWSLFDGMREGLVTAGANANCAGRRGSLTIGVRLLRQNPVTHAWHTVKARSRTFRRLGRSRFVEVASPCVPAVFRAVFRWTLRDTHGAVVARHRVRTQRLPVTSPACKLIISGPD